MKRKCLSVIITLIVALVSVTPSMAISAGPMSVTDDITVYIKGNYFDPDPEQGYEVVLKDDRTFLPLRYVAETLQYEVNWDQETQGISMVSAGTSVSMNVGNREYTVNGEQKTMDTEPFIQSDRTYVPLRFAAEAFGEKVQWDNSNRTAIIGSYSDYDLDSSSGTVVALKKAGIYIKIDEAALDGLYIEDSEFGTVIYDKASYDAYKADGYEGGFIATIFRRDYPEADMMIPGILLDYADGEYIQATLPSDVQAYIVDGEEQPYVEAYNANSDMVKECLKHIAFKAEDTDNNTSQLAGGWNINRDELSVESNPEAGEALKKATEGLAGYTYEPVAVLASQVVAGTNYCILCRGEAVVPDATPEYELVYVYEDPEGNAKITSLKDLYSIPETDEPLSGGWGINTGDVSAEAHKEVVDALNKAIEGMGGSNIEPIAYLGSQVVAGMNYKIVCRITPVVPDGQSEYAIIQIYADLQGNAEITNITDIDIIPAA